MRQVPVLDGGPIGIVGDGYPARHFLHYLNRSRLSVYVGRCGVPASARDYGRRA